MFYIFHIVLVQLIIALSNKYVYNNMCNMYLLNARFSGYLQFHNLSPYCIYSIDFADFW